MVVRIRLKPKAPPPAEPNDAEPSGIIVNINPKWRLSYDGLQFHVETKRVSGKGVTHWIAKAYCRDLDNAIIWLARHRIYTIPGEYSIEALEHLCKALDKIIKECTEGFRKLVGLSLPPGQP